MERRPGKVPLPGHRRLSPVPVPNHSLRKSGKPGVYYVERQGVRHYKVSYADSTGKRRWRWLGPVKLGEAVKQREDMNVSIRRREVVVSGEAMRWPQAVEGFRQLRTVKRPDEQDRLLRLHVDPQWEHLKCEEITPHMVEALLRNATRKDGRLGPLSSGTKEQILNVIRPVFDYAVEARAIASNPARQINRKRKPRQGKLAERILAPDEQTRLLMYCGRVPWLRPIIEVAVLQALRLGEVLALRPKDVDFRAGKLTVLRSLHKDGSYGPTKGWMETDEREIHVIDLHPQAAEILRGLTPDSADKPYFRNTRGEQRAYQDVGKTWGKVRVLAGLSAEPRLPRFHDLRHTAISRLANAPNAQIPWVQKFARHKKIETTYGYVHEIRDEERVKAAWAALSLEHFWNTESGNTGSDGE
jgi:integrase